MRAALPRRRPISGPGMPAASRSSPLIASRTWRTRSSHSRAAAATLGELAPAQRARERDRLGRGPCSASRSWEGLPAASAAPPGRARQRGAHRAVALAGGELEARRAGRTSPARGPRRLRGRGEQQQASSSRSRSRRRQQLERGAREALVEAQARRSAASTPSSSIARAQPPRPPRRARGAARRPTRAPETVSSAPAASAAGQLGGAWLDLEAQPRAVAREAQQARGVLEEAALVQHAQAARARSSSACAAPSSSPAARAAERDGDRVDGEVPARRSSSRARAARPAARRARRRTRRAARRCRCALRPTRAPCRSARAAVTLALPSVALESAASSCANFAASRATTTSSSRGVRPSSRSRTAPPTSCESSRSRREREQLCGRRARSRSARAPRGRVWRTSRSSRRRPCPALRISARAPGFPRRPGAPWPGRPCTGRSGRSTRTAPRRRPPRSACARCSSSPAPPEAITGTLTASLTARVSARS